MDNNPGETDAASSAGAKAEEQAVVETPQVVEVVEAQDRPTRWLTFLSSLAEVVSWLVLVLLVGIGIYSGYSVVEGMRGAPVVQVFLSIATGGLYMVLMGLFYFIVLQAIAKGINILLDIRDNAQYLVEDEE